jgi:hypothetical protein
MTQKALSEIDALILGREMERQQRCVLLLEKTQAEFLEAQNIQREILFRNGLANGNYDIELRGVHRPLGSVWVEGKPVEENPPVEESPPEPSVNVVS